MIDLVDLRNFVIYCENEWLLPYIIPSNDFFFMYYSIKWFLRKKVEKHLNSLCSGSCVLFVYFVGRLYTPFIKKNYCEYLGVFEVWFSVFSLTTFVSLCIDSEIFSSFCKMFYLIFIILYHLNFVINDQINFGPNSTSFSTRKICAFNSSNLQKVLGNFV